jgi:hypothetical protein
MSRCVCCWTHQQRSCPSPPLLRLHSAKSTQVGPEGYGGRCERQRSCRLVTDQAVNWRSQLMRVTKGVMHDSFRGSRVVWQIRRGQLACASLKSDPQSRRVSVGACAGRKEYRAPAERACKLQVDKRFLSNISGGCGRQKGAENAGCSPIVAV